METRLRGQLAALAVAVLALILAVVSPAIGGGSGPSNKKLAKEIRALRAQVAALQQKPGPPGPQGPGATKIWVDTNVGIQPGLVFETADFQVDTECLGGSDAGITITPKGSAAIAVNGTQFRGSIGGTPTTTLISQFTTSTPVSFENGLTNEQVSGTVLIQSYGGLDTSHNYTLQYSFNDGGAKCFIYGSITPAS